MITVLEVIKKTSEFLATKGVESPRLNAEIIVGHALNLSRMKLYLQFERILTEAELEVIRSMVRRRGHREPLQYILGYVDFNELMIKVDKRALIPRPETELLVNIIIQKLSTKSPSKILDLGTGSGAIALALANYYSGAVVTAVDASQDALNLAFDNIMALGFSERVKPLLSSWYDSLPIDSMYDLIVSNPPYLTANELALATPEVNRYEPSSALVADQEGLSDIKIILSQSHDFLKSEGIIALETGETQHQAIKNIAVQLGYTHFDSFKDLAGKDRFVLIAR